MNKQDIAEKLEQSILERVHNIMINTPSKLTIENKNDFVDICEKIDKITTDAFTEAENLGCRDFFSGWQRIFAPWWKNGYDNWEYAYGEGFTWDQFLDYIIECNCNTTNLKIDNRIPTIFFADKENKNQFCIELGTED